MARRKEKLLTLPERELIVLIAWYEWQGRLGEAAALREIGIRCEPRYEIDEAAVQQQIALFMRPEDPFRDT